MCICDAEKRKSVLPLFYAICFCESFASSIKDKCFEYKITSLDMDKYETLPTTFKELQHFEHGGMPVTRLIFPYDLPQKEKVEEIETKVCIQNIKKFKLIRYEGYNIYRSVMNGLEFVFENPVNV